MKYKNLFLTLMTLMLLNFNCILSYKYNITNLSDENVSFQLWPCQSHNPNNPAEQNLLPAFSKKSVEIGSCCVADVYLFVLGSIYYVDRLTLDTSKGCKGVYNLDIARGTDGLLVIKGDSGITKASTKEASEMEVQAKSGDIKLKFMKNKDISVAAKNDILSQNKNYTDGILHYYVLTIPTFAKISANQLDLAETMVTADLLDQGNSTNETPLHVAARLGRRDWVLFLVRHRADVFVKDNSMRNALLKAAHGGDPYIIQLIIKSAQMILDEKLKSNKINGLEYTKTMYDFVNSKDDSGNTPFDYAENVDSMRIFLDPKRTANIQAKADINKLDSGGSTKLINAILNAKEGADVLDALIKYPGIDLQKANAKGEKPGLMAVSINKNFVGKRLPGASPFITEKLSVQTPLEKLLRAGLNPKDAVDKEGNNLLHIASVFGDINSFQKIVNRVSPEDLFIKNKKGQNALHLATLAHNRDAVEYLYRLNPKLLQEKDDRGKIPLDYAIQEGFKDLVEFLKKPGAIMPAPYETDKEKRLREEQSKIKK